ncbi:hypothetical protein BC834DRAFT_970505 [Gloeopeniophorella convolvens]|nr:hypothetical protein BC834DRAFT_975443 [Gloeopeniophorella convolvens]KAI0260786.1 hypothetical protein BC834DRAFT_973237 [Gloeopeniophorella convolvens]KAI0264944.1 hypothetical protein BC834DRAFT_970505 [Gloeopeniophorella convolvens]
METNVGLSTALSLEHYDTVRLNIALVLTATHCCLDEWATGVKSSVTFAASDYKPIYVRYMDTLAGFEAHTQHKSLSVKLRQRLHDNGRVMLDLPTAAFDAALEEEDSNSATESESDE